MIKSIAIQGYKSFHPTTPVTISLETATQKPVFFYGLNGAGKTAIGEVIHGRSIRDAEFQACRVDTTQGGPFRYLVYNHHFVHSEIGEAAGMPGIFTIGELNTETQRKIEERERLLQEVRGVREAAQRDVVTINGQLATALNDAKEDVWTVYKAHDKGAFDSFLTGYGRGAQKFFDDLRTYATPDDETLEDLDSLAKRLVDISGDETRKGTHQLALGPFQVIERDAIWQEQVEVSGESRLAPMVEKLGNGDWVSKGRAFVHDGQCPFCQQGLTHGFPGRTGQAFGRGPPGEDRSHRRVHHHLRSGHPDTGSGGGWSAGRTPVPGDGPKSGVGYGARPLEGEPGHHATETVHAVRAGGSCPNRPAADEGRAIGAQHPHWHVQSAHPEQGGERSAIRDLFWKNMCRDRIGVYRVHDARIAPLNEQLAAAQTKDREAGTQEAGYISTLTELRKKQEGVDASVAAINERLKGLGIESFSIARKSGEGSLYCLERPAHGESSAQTLSEGEKTLISFVYFIELLKGSNEQGAAADISKTVVVIDDPISSLSHNFVYDIASIICHELIKPPGGQNVRQVIVLTHNLFFLHELVYQAGAKKLDKADKHCQLLRVVKSDHSQVVPMDARVLPMTTTLSGT